jgi:hypothetical protein
MLAQYICRVVLPIDVRKTDNLGSNILSDKVVGQHEMTLVELLVW